MSTDASAERTAGVKQLRLVVRTEDFDQAVAFYRDVLGLTESEVVEGEGDGRVAILDAGRATLELSDPAQAHMIDAIEAGGRPSAPLRVAFEVDDAARATSELEAAGAEVIAEPTATPWRSLNSRLHAPAGLEITLFQELDATAEQPHPREVDDYFGARLLPEDDALTAARESSVRTTLPGVEVAPNQGALLALLTRIAGARRVLEFGTLAGYSAIWFARAVGEAGAVVTLELEERNAAVARENLVRAGVADRVEILVGPAAESAEGLIATGGEPFDLVFIDADKPNNPTYLEAALRLTGPGALIVIDNVVRGGAVADRASEDPSVRGVQEVVEMIAAHPDLEATALQSVGIKGWDGLILARRRGSSHA